MTDLNRLPSPLLRALDCRRVTHDEKERLAALEARVEQLEQKLEWHGLRGPRRKVFGSTEDDHYDRIEK